MPDQWQMYAHDDEGLYTNLGARPWVELHGLRLPIVLVDVRLVADDDPAATHWGWLETGADGPTMIWPSHAQFSVCFPYGYRAEEEAGKGRAVRLAVTRVPQRIQRQRTKGSRLPAGTRVIDRTTGFGNPFTIADATARGHENPQRTCVELHAAWLDGEGPDQYHVGNRWFDRRWVHEHLHELQGRDLACTCGPDDPCHGDTLLRLANEAPE